jgi:hypothetical protein
MAYVRSDIARTHEAALRLHSIPLDVERMMWCMRERLRGGRRQERTEVAAGEMIAGDNWGRAVIRAWIDGRFTAQPVAQSIYYAAMPARPAVNKN